jgi:hypothetical protein
VFFFTCLAVAGVLAVRLLPGENSLPTRSSATGSAVRAETDWRPIEVSNQTLLYWLHGATGLAAVALFIYLGRRECSRVSHWGTVRKLHDSTSDLALDSSMAKLAAASSRRRIRPAARPRPAIIDAASEIDALDGQPSSTFRN